MQYETSQSSPGLFSSAVFLIDYGLSLILLLELCKSCPRLTGLTAAQLLLCVTFKMPECRRQDRGIDKDGFRVWGHSRSSEDQSCFLNKVMNDMLTCLSKGFICISCPLYTCLRQLVVVCASYVLQRSDCHDDARLSRTLVNHSYAIFHTASCSPSYSTLSKPMVTYLQSMRQSKFNTAFSININRVVVFYIQPQPLFQGLPVKYCQNINPTHIMDLLRTFTEFTVVATDLTFPQFYSCYFKRLVLFNIHFQQIEHRQFVCQWPKRFFTFLTKELMMSCNP